MRVIFLDIDGVLNGSKSSSENIRLYREGIKIPNIDIEKIKILAEITKEFDCKIVLSSSWKLLREIYNEEKEEYELNHNLKYLLDLFKEYNIEFIGYTPNVNRKRNKISDDEMWKENDIRLYLLKHPEIDHFVVIDDENYDLHKVEDYLVQTDYIADTKEEEGLSVKHKEKIKQILCKENRYRF